MNKYLPLFMVLLVAACGSSGGGHPTSAANSDSVKAIEQDNTQGKIDKDIRQQSFNGGLSSWDYLSLSPWRQGINFAVDDNYDGKEVYRITTNKKGEIVEEKGSAIKILNKVLPHSVVAKKDIYDGFLTKGDISVVAKIDELAFSVDKGISWYSVGKVNLPANATTDSTVAPKANLYVQAFAVNGVGAFNNATFYREKATRENIATADETHTIQTYELGKVNGYKQAYLMLSTWEPNEVGRKPFMQIHQVVPIGLYGDKIGISYAIKNTLSATYKGVAYSSRTGLRDGNLSLDVDFGLLTRQRIVLSGAISNRTQDNGQDVIIERQATQITQGGSGTEFNAKMGEVSAQGKIIFGGTKAEEVAGYIKFDDKQLKDGENIIGFIGERDTSKDPQ